jgi:hypothetical protein
LAFTSAALGLQTAAGAQLIHITVKIELEQISGWVGGPSAPLRVVLGKVEAGGAQIQRGDEGVQEAHGVVRANVIFQRGGQEMGLLTIRSFNPVHAQRDAAFT